MLPLLVQTQIVHRSANSLYACELDNTSNSTRSKRGIGPLIQMPGPMSGGLHLPDFPKPLINSPNIGHGPNIGPQAGILNSPIKGPNSMRNQFNAFKKRFNRQYGPNDDPSKRFQLFKANIEDIKVIQDERVSTYDAQFDVTKFADTNFDDFRNIYTGARKPYDSTARKVTSTTKQPKCQKLQWTSRNIFPKIRDQLECGSCYAMSIADLIAAQNKIESNNFDDKQIEQLSPQYIMDCINPPKAYKCNGGRPVDILNQLALCREGQPQSCMLPSESCYPYKGKNGTCSSTCSAEHVV
uniref:Cathepsin propeptide inhibitor domain-containing protein n=1 Tax=Romanomermis culicivorax TaxID=13658 RepID=A0A915HMJ1_ROMCU